MDLYLIVSNIDNIKLHGSLSRNCYNFINKSKFLVFPQMV